MDLYTYRCDLVRVVDGDTVELSIDLGLRVAVRAVCRLHGIDAPKRRCDPCVAAEATKYLTDRLKNTPLTCRTHKDRTGKYGRYLVRLFDKDGWDINEAMVRNGHAKRY